jgi:hypothetical protein
MTNTHTPSTTPGTTQSTVAARVDTTALCAGGACDGRAAQQFEAEAFEAEAFGEVGSQAGEVVIPERMRQQAVRTEAALAAGTLPLARPDNLTELTERITQLREQCNRWHHDANAAQPGCAVDSDDSDDSDVAGWSR